MILIQLTGLSGSGKTTISNAVQKILVKQGLQVEILDGDTIRKTKNKDLGFSKKDRHENIRRLGLMGYALTLENKVVIIAAINPYEEVRQELAGKFGAKTVYIRCSIATLIKRDPKGLYSRALLPENHPDKLRNLSGVNDVFEPPAAPDLIIDTEENSVEESSSALAEFILRSE
ncbi:MAG TPA: adenylyl-sulfate kinase [Chitinophagaceae bacterium]|nr:adenylyl-sulfate kinase [Chitinophagaceae bacterium]